MNLWFRLLWLLLVSRRRPAVGALDPCLTPFRVLPTDLDLLRHVNNGVYLSIMDLARVDMMTRAGVLTKLRSRGWYPVVAAQTIRYRRSLNLWQRFDIETRVLGWDDRAILVQQRFLRAGDVVAQALVRARFLGPGGQRIAPADIAALMDLPPESPPLDDAVRRWNADQIAV